MDAFTNLATQVALANLVAQLTLLTKQLQSIKLQNAQFMANVIQPCPTSYKFRNDSYFSLDCQVRNPFAQACPPQPSQEKILV